MAHPWIRRAAVAAFLAGVELHVARSVCAQTVTRPTEQFQLTMDVAAALRAKDATAVKSLVAQNAVIVPGGGEIFGFPQVEPGLKRLFEKYDSIRVAIASLGSGGSGSMGFDRGTYELTLVPKTGASHREQGSYLAVLGQTEGKWTVVTLMWTPRNPEPATAPTVRPPSPKKN